MKTNFAGNQSPVSEAFEGKYGIVLMALAWAVGWGFGLGGVMELVDSSGEIADIWFAVLGYPGLVTGALFWGVLRMGERARGLDELSPGRVGAWGGVTGALLGTFLFLVGFARPQFDGLWVRSLVVIGVATLLCAISAVVLSVLVRSIGKGQRLGQRATS